MDAESHDANANYLLNVASGSEKHLPIGSLVQKR